MAFKITYIIPLIISSALSTNIPQVYETEVITASHFNQPDLQTEASAIQNGPAYTAPPNFDFTEYQKRSPLDPQKFRYLQQQKSDTFHANEQYHANYRDTRKDQQFQASQESSVRVQAPVAQSWKVIHPKFVTENVKDVITVTSLPTTMMEYYTSTGKQQNLLEKEEDMKRTGNYDKITPTLVPTDDSNRKGRIYKKSLVLNNYHIDDKEPLPTQQYPVQDRQDNNLGPYVRYLNPDLPQTYEEKRKEPYQNQDQLTALSSLIGKHPNVQLQGLNQLLLNGQHPVYHKEQTPVRENNHEDNNHGNNQQQYQSINANALENAILAQTKAIQSSGASPDAFSNLQAQLDATAKLHADKIIAQAQEKALAHVQAQHQAIALAQVQAEKAAIAQVQAQNEALERAHADAQAKAQQERLEKEKSVEDNQKKLDSARLQRLADERRRFQEQVRQQALQRKLREERERQEAIRKKNEQDDAATVAQKTRLKAQQTKISPAESQKQHYYQQVPQYAAPVQPYQLPSIHTYTPQSITLNPHKTPVKYTNTRLQTIQTPSESFVNVNAAGYNQHTKSEDADVSKYFVPPQVTAEEYKNAKGENDLLYAAKYAFGYRIRDYHNGNDFGHEEAKDGPQTKGHYHVLLPDGRVQNVHYIADEEGFHAKVSYGAGITSSGGDGQGSAEVDHRSQDV